MYWEEDKDKNSPCQVPDDVVDLSYKISCKCLPLDHAYAFSCAIRIVLPWLDEDPQAGIHLVHGAESGNGWMRPEDPTNELLHLSKRSRMTLRVPKHRIEDAKKLTGAKLDIDGHSLEVGKAKLKLFSTLPTQFARYVVVPKDTSTEDEAAFMEYAVEALKGLDIRIRKLLCGRVHVLQHPEGELHTRSLMLADLNVSEAVTLQQQGIGSYQKIGCGLFIPHKGITAVHDMSADKIK